MQWWDGAAWTHPSPPVLLNKSRTGLAVAALTIGIVAFVIGWIPIVGAIAGVVAIVLGIVALNKKQRKGFAITALILASVAVLASAGTTVIAYNMPQGQFSAFDVAETSPSPAPTAKNDAEAPAPQHVKSNAEYRDEAMTADGWTVYESGNLYVQFADPSEFTCGYANCTYVYVAAIHGCPNSLYVEASLMSGDTVIGMTNDLLGVVKPEDTAAAHLEDYAGNADSYRLTKVTCY